MSLAGLASVRTPAFVIDAAVCRANIAEALRRIESPDLWRVHVKTARSPWAYRLLLDAGVTKFKCSTVEEAHALVGAGARDVLLAFPAIGPTQSELPPGVAVLVDASAAMDTWAPGASMDVFLDVDTGMHRTGVPVDQTERIVALAREVVERGHRLRGLHSYDGHLADIGPEERAAIVQADLDRLADVAATVQAAEVVVGSTHTFTEVLACGWTGPGERTIGAGTVLYNDARALARFGTDRGFAVAARVLSRVVGVEGDRVTADAGLTAVQVDGGRPHLVAPGFEVVSVSQEHLVLSRTSSKAVAVGDLLLLTPAHVDTSIVQFPVLVVVDGDAVTEVPAVGRWTK